ncbi:unnamed protein product [Strongylus vulgaris]|uniref:Uncharacterized protein n=1 Tax=Strongylus vulgaris TaxID=40348 RepID=A0A3P7K2T0_STRVU|nr:unnamed protein product [Strongylus vulgaris]
METEVVSTPQQVMKTQPSPTVNINVERKVG